MKDESRSQTRRARQAAQTRCDILTAARQLFAVRGYAATSLAEIAAAAGTSIQTIYDSIGGKATLVAALNDLIDEEGGVAPLAGRIATETDPRQLLDIAVSITHNICGRCGDIVGAVYGAAHIEAVLAEVRDESRRRHREGIFRLTGRIAGLGGLRPDLDVARAADVIAVLTDPQVVRTFVVDYDWSWDTWHAWALDTLTAIVLADPAAPPRDRRTKRNG